MKRINLTISLLASLLLFFLGSCAVIEKEAGVLADKGKISAGDKEAIIKTSTALRKTFSDITEEEEYYIGRSVAALILAKYPVDDNAGLTQYINCVGNSVVFFSSRPETYAGYHFLILDSEEVNAFAAPGGFIFITKGLIRKCEDEEMLASVLAHEVGHVCAKHGLKSIKKSRLIEAFEIIGKEAAQRYGSEELVKLTKIFEDVLSDIVETLIERGYDRKYEYEADMLSVRTTANAGYSPLGLLDFLKDMAADSSDISKKGLFKTHPGAKERIAEVNKEIAFLKNVPLKEPVRTERFMQVKMSWQ
jgi:predicted Zn-dependent protease